MELASLPRREAAFYRANGVFGRVPSTKRWGVGIRNQIGRIQGRCNQLNRQAKPSFQKPEVVQPTVSLHHRGPLRRMNCLHNWKKCPGRKPRSSAFTAARSVTSAAAACASLLRNCQSPETFVTAGEGSAVNHLLRAHLEIPA